MPKPISSLPLGAKIKDTGTTHLGATIIWLLADKNHFGYPANSATLLSEKILVLRPFDGREADNPDGSRAYAGNNRYSLSNIRQWLNKAGAPWYAATHAYDKPPNSSNVTNGNYYDAIPGFLTTFTQNMQSALLPTNLIVAKVSADGGGSETVSDRLFLLSKAEVGLSAENGVTEGTVFPIFTTANSSRTAYLTAQAVAENNASNSSITTSIAFPWMVRSPKSGYTGSKQYVQKTGALAQINACEGVFCGVRPACNIPINTLVSDTPDTDGAYVIMWNREPTVPPSISVPVMVRSGKDAVITWTASTDPDGHAVSYELQRRWDSEPYSTIYTGAATVFTDTGITTEMNTVQWRVRAKDTYDAYSDYLEGPSRTVIHNVDPTVSGQDTDLGIVFAPPEVAFTVDDADTDDTLTVYLEIDGEVVDTIEGAERGEPYTFAMTGVQFAQLAQGEHVMTVRVVDTLENQAARNTRFTRHVGRIQFIVGPHETMAQAEKMLTSVYYEADAQHVTLEVCDNALDDEPVWERAMPGRKHLFHNDGYTAEAPAIAVRVTIEKGNYARITCRAPGISYI